ncbi:MAG: DEAD/DEAH box helicase family protein [Rhodothermales bacterium]
MAKKKYDPTQLNLLATYGKTAPAVPAIREAVREWREKGYPGTTPTTLQLLNYWFYTDHLLPNGRPFRYYAAQRESVEALIYAFEVAKTRTRSSLYQRFIPAELSKRVRLPTYDDFARYAIKMATGSGKTKVMSLVIAWQYFNAIVEADPAYAKTFLVIAPNVIVFERLSTDFAGGLVFKQDPVIPKSLKIYWDMQFFVRGEAERTSSEGAVYVTNIQQLYDSPEKADDEPDIMTMMLGAKPPPSLTEVEDFRTRILKRAHAPFMAINDEGHHTHEEDNVWNASLRSLHEAHEQGVAAQLDFSATPRYTKGSLFEWTVCDYPLKQAIIDRIVKRPVKGITDMGEVASSVPSVKYEPFVTAGIERWREYREQLEPLGKTPLLFVMMNDTKEADSIGEYLRVKYPNEFGGEKTLIIHTKRNGDILKRDLDVARKAAREVDDETSPVRAIVSVLMLREGWDVQNVTVIVGLRPYTAKANILPEQTIGRGLRLMFRGVQSSYVERVDIIGNRGFISFVEQLEKEEELQLETFKVGKDKLRITTIEPVPEKAAFDIAIPVLTPIIVRAKSLKDEIAAINVHHIYDGKPLPIRASEHEEQTFQYQGRDILTMEKLFERTYTLPTPQTAQEVVSYYAQVIAQELKLPSQFAHLAPKVRDFLRYVAFGEEVDLDAPEMIQAISRRLTQVVTMRVFIDVLRDTLIKPQVPKLEHPGRLLSGIEPFPWSQAAPECGKTIFNRVPCDNKFEDAFARFLDNAPDVVRFSKLPVLFGFTIPYTDRRGNLRHYYPDFVAVAENGVHYLIETKGREDVEVQFKDQAAEMWAERATELTDTDWEYIKVLQKRFNELHPTTLEDCAYYMTQI